MQAAPRSCRASCSPTSLSVEALQFKNHALVVCSTVLLGKGSRGCEGALPKVGRVSWYQH